MQQIKQLICFYANCLCEMDFEFSIYAFYLYVQVIVMHHDGLIVDNVWLTLNVTLIHLSMPVTIRLKAVKNIQKITKSMKMVAAAKYARAERSLKPARVYGTGALGKCCHSALSRISQSKNEMQNSSCSISYLKLPITDC